MWKLILLIIVNISCLGTEDKVLLINTGNNYEFWLNDDKGRLIYSINNADKTIEVDNERVFYIGNEEFSDFHIYEESVGTSQDFIFKHSDSKAYISEVYDKRALGDSLILSSFNSNNLSGKVYSTESKGYLIKFTPINY
ncbi:hypothetical protein LAG90_02455 [Marinilongibacter aquaticus]|uniref:hypothetical protein n=1 Tax=Marinilongibacter aquaticus TaxID=2975157 RepID=UPI0021BD2241|nr:hypothetical protein [Marinilongibacter aquaticus]UBM59517.1 hypothetical protein LAG90_02455 [Marinilongibacter aquaticus]